MRILMSLVVASFVFAGHAFAADPFANFYGNTTVVVHPEAGERKVLINEDGSYEQVSADGTSVAGTWSMDGANACFVSGEGEPYCVEAVSRNVGDSWEITAPDGTVEQASLMAGR